VPAPRITAVRPQGAATLSYGVSGGFDPRHCDLRRSETAHVWLITRKQRVRLPFSATITWKSRYGIRVPFSGHRLNLHKTPCSSARGQTGEGASLKRRRFCEFESRRADQALIEGSVRHGNRPAPAGPRPARSDAPTDLAPVISQGGESMSPGRTRLLGSSPPCVLASVV
jgi:hypothetical protein